MPQIELTKRECHLLYSALEIITSAGGNGSLFNNDTSLWKETVTLQQKIYNSAFLKKADEIN